MTQELIGELYQRYPRGELTLEDASEQIFALIRAEGIGGEARKVASLHAAANIGESDWNQESRS